VKTPRWLDPSLADWQLTDWELQQRKASSDPHWEKALEAPGRVDDQLARIEERLEDFADRLSVVESLLSDPKQRISLEQLRRELGL
jgi:hypothetical protein